MTERLFGTDGICGKANVYPMNSEIALRVGRAAGHYFQQDERPHTILIGKDTRKSCYMLESALTAGLCSMGVNVKLVGPLPTPGVSYIMLEHNTTGDGLITALQLLATMIRKDKSLAELASVYVAMPEAHKTIPLNGQAKPEQDVLDAITTRVETDLNGKDRIVIRPSGTEPIVRVMVQHESQRDADTLVELLSDEVKAL